MIGFVDAMEVAAVTLLTLGSCLCAVLTIRAAIHARPDERQPGATAPDAACEHSSSGLPHLFAAGFAAPAG